MSSLPPTASRRRSRALLGLALVLCTTLVGQANAQSGFQVGVSKFHTPTWGTNATGEKGRAGLVWDVVVHDDIVYMGGEFTSIAPTIELAGGIDGSSGIPLPGFPKLDNGEVLAATSDGEGGWYIGGSFNSVNSVRRNGLARIRHDGSLDTAWDAALAGPGNQGTGSFAVHSLARMGPYLYVGGEFTRFGQKKDAAGNVVANATIRNHIARVGAATGTVDGFWNPNVTGSNITTIAASPNLARVYFAGDFTAVAGAPRPGLASVNDAGALEGWAPAVGDVAAIAVSPDSKRIYLGTTNSVAAVNTAGAAVFPALAANNTVRSLVLSDNGAVVYAGGNFSSLGGVARARLAAVDALKGAVDVAWNPDANGAVGALSISEDGTKVYLGGDFTKVRGSVRNRLAAADAATGALESWDPNASGLVHSLAVSGSTVYAGGKFDNIGSKTVTMLASVSFTDGTPAGWAPGFPRLDYAGTAGEPPVVQAMAISADGQTIYIGGKFDGVTGPNGTRVARDNLAAVDLAGNVVTSFNPGSFQGAIRSMTLWDNNTAGVSDDLLYVGGDFDSVRVSKSNQNEPGRIDVPCPPAGEPSCTKLGTKGTSAEWARPGLVAAVDAQTGVLDMTFDQVPASTGPGLIGQGGDECTTGPECGNGASKAVVISADGRYLYSGGTFTKFAGGVGEQLGILSMDRRTGKPTAWQVDMNIPVFDLDLFKGDGKSLFTAAGGAGGRIQRFLPHEGPEKPIWTHQFDGDSVGVDSSRTAVYSAGHYDFVDGGAFKRKHASAFNIDGEIAVNFDPVLDTSTGPFTVEVVEGGAVIYGGEFSRVNNVPQPGVAVFSGTP